MTHGIRVAAVCLAMMLWMGCERSPLISDPRVDKPVLAVERIAPTRQQEQLDAAQDRADKQLGAAPRRSSVWRIAGAGRGGFVNGRLTIGGVPRWVRGVYISGGSYSTSRAFWEEAFFSPSGWGLQGLPLNLVLPYWLGNMPADATLALLDVLHARGVSLLMTGNSFADGSWRRQPFAIASEEYVRQFATHAAALGYYIADEPIEALLAETEVHRQQLATWDPQGITVTALMAGFSKESVRTNPAKWVNASDVLAPDPYPLYGQEPPGGYAHFSVADYVAKARAAAKLDRPIWAVLQLFKFTADSRLPTPDEMRAHAVMAVVEGAQGILWWDIGVNGLRKEDRTTVDSYMGHLKTLVTELAALEPALLAEPITGVLQNSTTFADPVAGRIAQLQRNVLVEQLYSRKQWYQEEIAALQAGDRSKSGGLLNGAATIRTRASVANGRGYVIAYNYTNVPTSVAFAVPGVEQYKIRVWENRTGQAFDVRDGVSWSTLFSPYEAKIFVIGASQ